MGYYLRQNSRQRICSLPQERCRTERINSILSSDSWIEKRCFIFGGGPSLLDFNYSQLDEELTIGINKSFTIFNPTINYAMDLKFYDYISCFVKSDPERKEIVGKWTEYRGMKVFLKPGRKFKFSKDVFVVRRTKKKEISFDIEKGIFGGTNSGFGALMLAIALGSKTIFLLGFDMKTNGENTHWHSGYSSKKKISLDQVKILFQRKLDKYSVLFEEFAPKICEQGITVINLNPNSALNCFPKDTIENVL